MIDDKKKEKLTSNSKKNVVQIDDIEQLKSEYAKSLEVFSYLLIHTPGIINEAIFRGLESKVNDLKEVYSETISNIKKEAEIRKANAEKRREEKAQKAKEIKAKKVEEAEIRRANAEKRREEKVQKAKEIKTKKEEKAEAKRINRSRAISDAKKNSQRTAFDIEYAKTIRQKEQKEWEDKYEGRNEYVKSGVRIINNTIGINALTMQAKGIAFLAGLASKGAALIGLRKLSNRIAEKGGEFALSKLRCTTIAGRYSMKIAEKGFETTDKLKAVQEARAEIKEGKTQIRKDNAERKRIERAKKIAQAQKIKVQKETEKEAKKEAKRINRIGAIVDAKENSQRTAFDIEYAKTIRQKEQREWEDKYEGRNEYVKSGVRIINNTIGINALTMQAKGIAFLAGLASKGAALIGLRKLSNRIAEKGGEFALSKLRCTTIAGRYSMKIAEKGFKISDKLNDIKETRAEIKEGKAQIRKDKLEKRKEKIEIGKGKYKAGDYAKAMGQVVLEGASKRIEKLQSGANKLAEDTGMVQSARKVSLIGIRAKIGFKGFIKNAAQGVVDKLNDSLLNDEMKKTKLELKTQENSSRFSNEIVPEL